MRHVRTMALGGVLGGTLGGAVVLLGAGAARAGDDVDGRLVVHAWGTFTTVQGADGTPVEGRPHEQEEETRPGADDAERREAPRHARDGTGLGGLANHAPDPRATSVLFFHTTTPRRVRVRLGVDDGPRAGERPRVERGGPLVTGADAAAPRAATPPSAAWDVDLLPTTGAAAPEPPPSPAATRAGDVAAAVDAAWVRARPGPGAAPAAAEAAPFLGDRGRGTFMLPMTAAFDGEGRLTFTNGSAHEVAQVIAIEVADGGTRGRYDVACYVQPGERRGADPAHGGLLADRAFEAWGPRGSSGLRGDLAKILRGQGLAIDEARALVDAWSPSWCASDGLRLLYVVPRPLVDEVLPLTVEPTPDHVVHVLLGRIECLLPARVAALEAALAEVAATGVAPTADAAGAAADRARALGGPFLEPLLRRVVAVTTDDGARRVARGWLSRLTAEAAAPRGGAR